jgi:putative transposase
MARYRLHQTPAQETILRAHCMHARYVWNLAVEQQSWWRPGRGSAPGYMTQCRQLTEARREHGWLADGSQMVQQQALRDFAQAMTSFYAGTHRKPTWRKADRHEGFRIVAVKPGHVRRLSRKTGQVWIPKAGWVRIRWSRAVLEAKSYRVTRDRAGRWHIAFAAVPPPIPGPGTGEVVGIDRGVIVSAALSDGRLLHCPGLRPAEQARQRRLQRKLARARKGSKARGRVEQIPPAYTSQRCSECGHVAADSRESQALFRCTACGYAGHADVNAARNIAAGHAVTARGRSPLGGRANREPQPLPLSA